MLGQITEELLAQLGFVQQNPPRIWDYESGGLHLRFVKSAGDVWSFIYRKRSEARQVKNFMDVVCLIHTYARRDGIEETQNNIHAALGLDRLVDEMSEKIQDEINNI